MTSTAYDTEPTNTSSTAHPGHTGHTGSRSHTGRLTRNMADKKLFGVCAGIAKHFDVDPTIVRLAFVLFAFVGGAAVPAYIIAALVIPEDNSVPNSSITFDGPQAA